MQHGDLVAGEAAHRERGRVARRAAGGHARQAVGGLLDGGVAAGGDGLGGDHVQGRRRLARGEAQTAAGRGELLQRADAAGDGHGVHRRRPRLLGLRGRPRGQPGRQHKRQHGCASRHTHSHPSIKNAAKLQVSFCIVKLENLPTPSGRQSAPAAAGNAPLDRLTFWRLAAKCCSFSAKIETGETSNETSARRHGSQGSRQGSCTGLYKSQRRAPCRRRRDAGRPSIVLYYNIKCKDDARSPSRPRWPAAG